MLYPILFEPLLKKVIWGGSDICNYKEISPSQEGIGESWEVSHVNDNFSVVANGPLKGQNIDDLIRIYGERLTGKAVMNRLGNRFPLLIKFIDAAQNLSIQVHPNDELAKKRHDSMGKTEMWYVIKAKPGASLLIGFTKELDQEEYIRRMEDNTIMEVMREYPVKEGEVFFLPAGRVHAICAGCMIAEIQQTSDITYRIYDYKRKDADGNERQLHTEESIEAINYTFIEDARTYYTGKINEPTRLVESPYFTTNLLEINKPKKTDLTSLDSFVIYICVEGAVEIIDNEGHSLRIHQGQTALVPAETKAVTLNPEQEARLLQTFIQV